MATITGYTKAYVDARRAWQFSVEDFGAKGDGKVAQDAATNSSNTFTSPTVAASAVVGQWVMIDGARGSGDTPAIGTITAIAGNNITIDTTARSLPINATRTALNVTWGTDDTAAINSAVAAAKTYAESHNYYAEVLFRDAVYVVSGLTQSNDSNILYNTQIPIPRPTAANGRKLVIGFKGAGRQGHHDYWNSSTIAFAGTTIVTTQVGPRTVSGTYLFQSVFGSGIPQSGGNMEGTLHPLFINHKPVFENIQVVQPFFGNVTAFDFQYSSGAYIDGCSAYGFAVPLYGNGNVMMTEYPTATYGGSQGCGLRLPIAGNNADVVVPEFECTGVTTAVTAVSEHVAIGTLKAFFNGVVLQVGLGVQGHGLTIERVTAEAYQGGIRCEANAIGAKVPLNVGMWNTETSATVSGGTGYDISDSNNVLCGEVNWFNTTDVDHTDPIVTGGGNLRVVNGGQARGVRTAPSLPATTVALKNPFWRDCAVTVTGGTVTAISVDGTSLGVTSGTVIVPTGKTITLTYSSAPTWKWIAL